MKHGPLSVTIMSGIPNLANVFRISLMTVCDVALGVQNASIHALGVGVNQNENILFSNGPAKSRCSRAHGMDGHFQGLRGATGGED